jgi:hypothetical protein
MFCAPSSRAFWRAGSGRHCELDAVRLATRPQIAVTGSAVFGCSPYVGHQRLERPEPTGRRYATSSPRRATRDRPWPGPSPPPAAHTGPRGAGPSCEPGLREGDACEYPRTRAGAPGRTALLMARCLAGRRGSAVLRSGQAGSSVRTLAPAALPTMVLLSAVAASASRSVAATRSERWPWARVATSAASRGPSAWT